METKKPNVFPTQEQIDAANTNAPIQNEGYSISATERAAEEEMLRRTEEQLRLRNEAFALQAERAAKAEAEYDKPLTSRPVIHTDSPSNTLNQQVNQIKQIDSSRLNQPYDLIPLPSEGKIYPHKKSKIKVAFLNASDENILTAPHLLDSGRFMEILFERKIIEEGIDYKDLHVGDRNAIMIWLRATAYGTNYPVQVMNPNTGDIIETEVDLSELKTKNLGAEPDKNGNFEFNFPVSGKRCKFKMLTVRDVEEIEKQEEYEINVLKKEYADVLTYRLERQIVEIDGNRDINYIRDAIAILRVGDSRAFRKYVNQIESGIDMNITIQVPGGEPFKTFLPIGFGFFWPEL